MPPGLLQWVMEGCVMDLKQIKLVALDLDDTLLNFKGQLLPATKQAIEELLRLGIEVVIASGRPYASLPEAVLSIPGIRYAVTSNGAAIHQVPGGKRIHGFTLTCEAVEVILSVTENEPVLLETFIGGVAYADARYVQDPVRYGAGEKAIGYIQRTRNPVDNIRGFIKENCGKLDSIDVICPQPEWKSVYAEKISALTQDVYLTTSCRQLLEISDDQAGKASALRHLCNKLEIEPGQCAAFGNAENDVDMIRFAGLGVAVSNATQVCLEAADLICGSNDEEGVAKVLWDMIKEITGC